MGRTTKIVMDAGERYGRWTIVRPMENNKFNQRQFWCQCDCGTERAVMGRDLRTGHSRGCRYCPLGKISEHKPKHQELGYSEYRALSHAKERCFNHNDIEYHNYGARGITVCLDWFGCNGFQRFLDEIGYKPTDKHQLDRIDNNGHYEPGNVRWVLPKIQANNKRNNVILTIGSESKTMSEWSDLSGVPWYVIQQRIKKLNWSHEEAVFRPVRGISKKGSGIRKKGIDYSIGDKRLRRTDTSSPDFFQETNP